MKKQKVHRNIIIYTTAFIMSIILMSCGKETRPDISFSGDISISERVTEDGEFIIIEKETRNKELLEADIKTSEIRTYSVNLDNTNLVTQIISNYSDVDVLEWVKVYHYTNEQFIERVMEFHEKGMLIDDTEYDVDGTVVSRYLAIYNDENRINEEVSLTTNNLTNFRVEYAYDDLGNTNEIVRYDESNEFAGMMIYTHDEEGRLTEEAYYGASGAPFYEYLTTYNEDGQISTMTLYHVNGDYNDYLVYGYDNDGYLESITTYSDDEGKIKLLTYYDYNFEKKTISKSVYLTNKVLDHTLVYHYDDQGRWIKKEFLDRFDLTYKKINWEYNQLGQLTNYESYLYGYLKEKVITNYNDLGLVTEAAKYGENKELEQKYLYDYDSVGHLLSKTYYTDEDKFEYRYEYYYNKFGELTNLSKYKTDYVPTLITDYEYNNFGLLVKEYIKDYIYLDPMDSLLLEDEDITGDEATDVMEIQTVIDEKEIIYEYDDYGNIIQKLTFNNKGQLIEIIEADIEYFEL